MNQLDCWNLWYQAKYQVGTPFFKNKLYKNNEAEIGKKEQIKNILRLESWKTKKLK